MANVKIIANANIKDIPTVNILATAASVHTHKMHTQVTGAVPKTIKTYQDSGGTTSKNVPTIIIVGYAGPA